MAESWQFVKLELSVPGRSDPVKGWFSLADVLILVGLVMLGAALWLVDPRLALGVVGIIIGSLGLWASLPGRWS